VKSELANVLFPLYNAMIFVRRNVYLFIASVSYLSLERKLTHGELSLENRIDRHKETNNIHLVFTSSRANVLENSRPRQRAQVDR
jgi:hypothetical protein